MSRTPNAFILSAVLVLLLAELSQAEQMPPAAHMDIFTTSNQPIKRLNVFVLRHPEIALRVHTLDAIERFEDDLSQGLPADPQQAKRLALGRLQQLSTHNRTQLQHAATSIATALSYGIKKYPAIVFDGEFVVYGLSDPLRALEHYRRWRLPVAS